MQNAASGLLSGAYRSGAWEKRIPSSRGIVNCQSQVQLRL